MEGVQVHCQCLLFVVRKNRRRAAREPVGPAVQEGPKGFALLPSSTAENHPQFYQLFGENSIEVLDQQECPSLRRALEQNLVEILEVVFVGCAGGITSESLPTPLVRVSVEAGNEKCVKELFGKKIVFHSMLVESPNLLKAVDEPNIQTVKNILSVRADISYRSRLGGTFLHLAVLRDQESLVNLLLKHGANINAERNDDSTPLHLAVEQGNLNLIGALLENGAHIDAEKEDGSTCLLLAVEQGNTEVVKLLLKNGADITIGKKADSTPLHVALQKGYVEVFNDLLEQESKVESLVIPPSLKDSLLFLAIEKGVCKIVERLLECGANVNAQNRFGESALERAVDYGHVEVVECILNHHPDVKNKNNKKALTEAVLSNNKECVKIVEVLLKYGFSLEADEINNVNLMQALVRKNYVEILQHLLNPENVTELTEPLSQLLSNTSLLYDAVKQGNEEMVKLLLDSGVKPSNNPEGTALLHEALKKGSRSIVKLLIAHGARANDRGIVCLAAEKGFVEVVEAVMQSGVSVDFEDSAQRLAIVTAAENNHPKVVEVLLKYGANSEKRNKFGRTALHAAAESGLTDVIRVLVENGANLDVKCPKGQTPLSYAVGSGQLRAVEMLLKYGARLDVIDSSGGSPLRIAVEEEYKRIFQVLLDYGFGDPNVLKKTDICNYLANKVHWQAQMCFMLQQTGMGGENFENEEKCCLILARHILRLEAAGLCCDEENPGVTWGWSERSMSNFRRNCAAEIALLKSCKVGNVNVSFYDVLMSKETQLKHLAKNPEVVQFFESVDYTKFPIYGGCLHYQFLRGFQRKKRKDVGNSA